MPRLGWDMKVGSVAEWLKRDGDRVEVGEAICMIAGDKATTELEALDEGILRIPPHSPEPGEEVPVGTLLAYLLAPGEDDVAVKELPLPLGEGGGEGSLQATGLPAYGAPSPALRAASPRGRGLSDPDGGRRVVASPRARRAAAALGVEWRALVGSGRGGRVLERDVQHASAQEAVARPTEAEVAARAAAAGAEAAAGAGPEAETAETAAGAELAAFETETVVRLHGVRRVTAERMALSARTVAPVTLTTEADATTLVRLREQALAERGASPDDLPSYIDFVVKLAALALAEHPALNAELTDDGIVQHARVDIGIAVDTPRGLLVPVVRDATNRSLAAIASESSRLIQAVKNDQARPEDLTGATFTITNLGMFEIDAFTPIVNLPQCAILGIGRIVARPVVVDEASEQVAVRRMLALSLTFDHRLVDGAPAARFLQRIKHFVERPTLWLFR